MLRDTTNEQQPQKDRRALLMEWRKQARSRSGTSANSSGSGTPSSGVENSNPQINTPSAPMSSMKRSRLSLGVLPAAAAQSPANQRLRMTEPSPGLPPSYVSSDQPMGATQRFRLAKEMQRQQKEQQMRGMMFEMENNNQPSSLNDSSYIHEPNFSQESCTSTSFIDDNGESSTRNRIASSRRMSIAGGAKKMRRKSIAVSNSTFDRGLSQESTGSIHNYQSISDQRPHSAPKLGKWIRRVNNRNSS